MAVRQGVAWAAALVLLAVAGSARAQSFGGALQYTGGHGPVNGQRPLCVCLYTDPGLTHSIGCLIVRRNDTTYHAAVGNRDYYAVAFLDLHINERLDADEPYEIFQDRAAAPGVAIAGGLDRNDVDFVFGDENLPGTSPTATATPVAVTPTATPPELAADCDGSGTVSVDELVSAVAIALETRPLSTCPAADRDADGAVRIEELIAALNAALDS